jgi:AraC-like DNA-binding protein
MYNVFNVHSSSDWQLPQKSCLVNFSVLKELCCPAPFRSFSIKYVSRGNEHYTVNGNNYQVRTGEYLLANHFSEGMVEIDKEVKGICIDVAPAMLSEVVASFRKPGTPVPDVSLDIFFNTPDFFENKYRITDTHVGKFLQQLDEEVSKTSGNNFCFSEEFYFTLAEKIVLDHLPVYKQLQSVNSVKPATRKELLRRITRGKEYLDTHFQLPLRVETIAMECGLSEYHFYRLFKSVFGISPHRQLVQNRLHFASSLLRCRKATVTEAALSGGFPDVYSFSKSFKKHFGFSPSLIAGK